MSSKKNYRVRDGNQFGLNGEYGPGAVVALTDEEYVGLEDKLAPIEQEAAPPPPAPPVNDPSDQDAPEAEEQDEAPENADEETAEETVADDGSTEAEEDAQSDDGDEQYPASVLKAVANDFSVEEPSDLVFLSDKEILEVKGIGEAGLKEIREHFPYEG